MNEDAPAFPCAGVEFVNLEGHLILGVRRSGAEILVHRAVLARAEHNAAVMKPVVHGKHGQSEPPGVRDPANILPRQQPEALLLVQILHDRPSRRLIRPFTMRHLWHSPLVPHRRPAKAGVNSWRSPRSMSAALRRGPEREPSELSEPAWSRYARAAARHCRTGATARHGYCSSPE